VKTHAVIPDCQVKKGCSNDYLSLIGRYLAEKKPDVIVNIGDFADMPSLSSYDVGKKDFEGRRYRTDVEYTHDSMQKLVTPIFDEMTRTKRTKKPWKPQMVLTLGNHEHRINKVVNNDAKLEGTIGVTDLGYENFGWDVYPFLEPVFIDGVAYCHYFTSGVMGRPVTNARMLVTKKLQSCVMGHVQHWDIHRSVRADGKAVIGLFAGSCYTHDEDYLGPQGNNYDRGFWMLHEVHDGDFQPMYVSLKFLEKKYGKR
jgi:hypothetical protein